MDIIEIIEHKRDKKKLSKEEIEYFIKGYVNNEIKDYQASSLLMAIYLNGMEKDEIANLTEAMRVSGEVWDLSCIEGIKVDKHSTGGVGDKVSLILGPMIASLGAKLAKMSGRGLGHTGGTIDKLESIPGFRVNLTKEEFINQVNNVGMAIIGQDKNIDPADKKIYALRDVTGTVSSIPLIASSIMSKKLASGADAILLDVKYGNGAFMKTIDEAKKLATTMVEIGKSLNKDVKAELVSVPIPKCENGYLGDIDVNNIWKTIKVPFKKYVIFIDNYRFKYAHFSVLSDFICQITGFQNDYEDYTPDKYILYASDVALLVKSILYLNVFLVQFSSLHLDTWKTAPFNGELEPALFLVSLN